jgi:hypothetical protein
MRSRSTSRATPGSVRPRLGRRTCIRTSGRRPMGCRSTSWGPSREGTRPIHLRRRERPGALPVRRADTDRGRFGSARIDDRARHVSALRAVRRVVEPRRPTGGERCHLRPGLEPAPPRDLDVRRRRRAPDPARARALGRGQGGQHRAHDPVHGLVHDGRVRLAGPPRGRCPRPDCPPMGARFRLKSDFDLGGFSQRARTILRAMQQYGLMLADNGSNWYFQARATRTGVTTCSISSRPCRRPRSRQSR